MNSPEDSDSPSSGAGHLTEELDPEIGLLGALAIGVRTMIAAGIFVLLGLAVSNVGAVAIGSFLLAAVIAGFTAAAYGEFSSIYQESGGDSPTSWDGPSNSTSSCSVLGCSFASSVVNFAGTLAESGPRECGDWHADLH